MTIFLVAFTLGILVRYWLDKGIVLDKSDSRSRGTGEYCDAAMEYVLKGWPTQTYFTKDYVRYEVDDS